MEAIAANILLEGLAVNALAQCETPVTLVTTDSREVCPGCIFVAFPGEKFDGHDFAAKALENGALCVVLNHPVEGVPEEKSVICPDSYHAMMVLGANYRSQFHPKVVGVTGSVGSLFLAGMLGCVPLCIGWPDLTLPLALPFWLEGGMVALQILVCKASRGRRQLFRSAPLHRWLELRGQSAEQIFYTFCVIAMLGVALTVQLAKIS